MKVVNLDKLKPAPERAAKFEGESHGAANSFFVVTSPPGRGVNKHRHPYEEILIILGGDIEIGVGEESKTIGPNNAVVVPPNTWHEFINKSDHHALMVTIHNSAEIIQEDYQG